MGYPLQAIHIPKTIDNDLPLTDCCPGFGSVAKYIAISTREAAMDVASMCETSTKVFILEGLDSWLYQTSSFNFLTQRMNVVFPRFAPVKQLSHLLDLV